MYHPSALTTFQIGGGGGGDQGEAEAEDKTIRYEESDEQAFASRAGSGAGWQARGWVSSYQAIGDGSLQPAGSDLRGLTGHDPNHAGGLPAPEPPRAGPRRRVELGVRAAISRFQRCVRLTKVSTDASRPRTSSRRAAEPLEPFEVVVERHGPALLRFCVVRLGPDRGEDACQEALIAAMRHYPELRDPRAVGGWLFSIAQHKIVDAARSGARAPLPSDQLEEHAAVWNDPEPTGGIWTQVAMLPPKQREAVALRYLAELSHAEVAAVMATSVEAARRNVFEGLERLRKEFPDVPDRR